MNIKQVVSGFLMVILSIFLILLVLCTSVVFNIKSQSIIKAMDEVNYIENADSKAKEVLKNYLPEEKVEQLLKRVSAGSIIQEIVLGLDNNTVEKIASEKEQEIKKEIVNILDEDVDENSKQLFAQTVSSEYIKALLPTFELNTISKINAKYSEKLVLALIIVFILCIGILFFLYKGRKTFKWGIIALYNGIIFSTIVLFLLNEFNNIAIGNKNTTALILQLLKQIKIDIIIEIVIITIIAILFNYIAYFRKRNKKKNKF